MGMNPVDLYLTVSGHVWRGRRAGSDSHQSPAMFGVAAALAGSHQSPMIIGWTSALGQVSPSLRACFLFLTDVFRHARAGIDSYQSTTLAFKIHYF